MSARAASIAGSLLVASAFILCGGCGHKSAEDRAAARLADASQEPGPAARAEKPFDPLGTWTVVGHSTPGISAVSEDEAKAHYGQIVRLDRAEAFSNGERCAAPAYPSRSVETEDYLAREFNLPPESLPPLADKYRVTIVDISCDRGLWTPFGSLLIAIDANRALTPWDGAFYELKRTPPAG